MKGFLIPNDLELVLCVGAHADDIEIGAGGILATLASSRPHVRFLFVVLTADKRRRAEAAASAEALLGDRVEVRFGEFEDSYLPYRDPAGVKDYLKTASPPDADLVIGPNQYDAHQDHRFVSDLLGEVYRDHVILGYEVAKYDGDLGRPNVYFPLTAEAARSKADHIGTYFDSQAAKPWFNDETFTSIMRLRGIESRAPEGYAEAFYSPKVVVGLAQ